MFHYHPDFGFQTTLPYNIVLKQGSTTKRVSSQSAIQSISYRAN
ncbi:hypothetical protein HMPREF3156_02454 [Neisseria sp. HMSC06F02]|nr:hypothetical protein HMPREF3156_02454 [Neisseria sp. HMSC06F02]